MSNITFDSLNREDIENSPPDGNVISELWSEIDRLHDKLDDFTEQIDDLQEQLDEYKSGGIVDIEYFKLRLHLDGLLTPEFESFLETYMKYYNE